MCGNTCHKPTFMDYKILNLTGKVVNVVIVLSDEGDKCLKLKDKKKIKKWIPKAKLNDDKLLLKIIDTKCTASEIKDEKNNGKPANVKSANYVTNKNSENKK